ncbi:MAG: hypothetical protein H0V47_06240 [Chloroflexia bacterium]|nr:hypothetical protein [Chloroflexia bacterium]
MVSQTTLKPQTRVRLRDNPFGVQLRSMSGYIERLELSSGCYIVQLDEPAIYFHADGTTEDLPAVREAGDNLIVEHMEQ